MKAGDLKRIKGTRRCVELLNKTGIHGERTWNARDLKNGYEGVVHEDELRPLIIEQLGKYFEYDKETMQILVNWTVLVSIVVIIFVFIASIYSLFYK